MTWENLLQAPNEFFVLPWLGGKTLHLSDRTWKLNGNLPAEFGWFSFGVEGRKAKLLVNAEPNLEILTHGSVKGYLIGDRLIPDSAQVDFNNLIECSERVYFLEPGLDRFVRIEAGRHYENGPLIFKNQDMPLGPEEEVLKAFLDNQTSVDHVKNVSPALDSAFKLEVKRKVEAEKRRIELEEAERKKQLKNQLGDAGARRELAKTDFAAAAKAELMIGGAEYIEHRPSFNRNEMIVRFRLQRERFECVCHAQTLQIIDAGICLTDHRGTKGDTWLSLGNLPAVIAEALRTNRLHRFRYVD